MTRADDSGTGLCVAALQYCAGATPRDTMPGVEATIRAAGRKGANLVCLPEAASFLAASPEALGDLAEWEDDSRTVSLFAEIAGDTGVDILVGSIFLRRREDRRLVNRQLLIGSDGTVRAQYDKIHMFDADVGDGKRYRESENFAAGDRMIVTHSHGVRVGMSVCYDLRFPRLYLGLAGAGAQVLVVPAAFTYNSGMAHWHVLLRARAIETGCFIVAPAQCGTHADGRRTYGHAMIISPWGEILAEAETDDDNPAAGANDDVIVARIDTALVDRARAAIPSLANQVVFKNAAGEPAD